MAQTAALYIHPDAFAGENNRLLGRHSAGASFLRGYLRHADTPKHWFWNVLGRPVKDVTALVEGIEPIRKPVQWIGRTGRPAFQQVGVLNVPGPSIAVEARQRSLFGATTYAVCGITHTTATDRVMRELADTLVAPVDGHDALICTSDAVRAAVDAQLEMMRQHMATEYGPRRRAEPMRVTIPLGVNVADFVTTDHDRKTWRERLDIPANAVVALFVGRFNVRAKMNPALMARALERAAADSPHPICWVNSGWAESEGEAKVYHEETRKLCPSVLYREVDGRLPDVRFSIWSVGDFFISFSDNIQESFGLTPVEAMAAGLPSVVSDWDGYKDTVRHGVDGFRIPTLAPRPGLGGDFAHWYDNSWLRYPDYIGGVAQNVAVDLAAAEAAIRALVADPALRARQGQAAQERALSVFDWAAIIPQYQALWTEQEARRRAAKPEGPRVDPRAPDPYTLFGGYPTRHLQLSDLVTLASGLTWDAMTARLAAPLAAYSPLNRPNATELRAIFDALALGPLPAGKLIELADPGRRSYVERGLIWLARHDVVAISAA